MKESPKPPPERITFTLPVVNAARQVVFVALGEGKAEIVQRVLEVGSASDLQSTWSSLLTVEHTSDYVLPVKCKVRPGRRLRLCKCVSCNQHMSGKGGASICL